TGASCSSRGRSGSSLSPPPWFCAWARKSGSSGACSLRVSVRITSRVGRMGAAASLAKPTPRISTPNRMVDRVRVAPRRSPGPVAGGAGVAVTATTASAGAAAGAGLAGIASLTGSGPAPAAPAGLDGVEQQAGDVQAELGDQLADTGRAGHVHLGQPVADHVQADEDHAAAPQFRADPGGDPAVAIAQGPA